MNSRKPVSLRDVFSVKYSNETGYYTIMLHDMKNSTLSPIVLHTQTGLDCNKPQCNLVSATKESLLLPSQSISVTPNYNTSTGTTKNGCEM